MTSEIWKVKVGPLWGLLYPGTPPQSMPVSFGFAFDNRVFSAALVPESRPAFADLPARNVRFTVTGQTACPPLTALEIRPDDFS